MPRRWQGAVVAVLSGWPAVAGAGPAPRESASGTLSPYFVVVGGDEAVDRLPLLGTSVDVSIAGVIADVTVRQTYKNAGARPLHATYVFPASTRAAVHGLTLTVGDERIRARIREREQARREFEKAKRESKTASLLEQERPNVFRMSVANVLPGDRIEVELRYSELLVPEAGVYEFVYPTVVGPRYSSAPAAAAPPSERWIASPYTPEGTPPAYTLALAGRVSAGLPIADLGSPSHRIGARWTAPGEVEVALDTSGAAGGDRDFVLRYRLTGREVQSGLLLHEGEDESFFLLTVQPPRRVEGAHIPPREYVFVVDVSGSMHGFPLETAKGLVRSLIGELRPTDAFNLVFFAGGSRVLAPASLPARPENVEAALRMLDSQGGGGGTELLAAVRRAMALPGGEGTSRSLVVVTDGYIAAEREVFHFIRENLNGANVFAFGIGSSVNRHLIEGIARAGLGEPFVVLDPSEAPEAARRFREYVGFPVLTDVEVAFEGLEVHDLEPASIPDVLADRPVVVSGKWTGRAAGRVVVKGVSGSGEYRQVLDVEAAAPSPANRALGWLWAKARVASLSEVAFGPETEEERGEVVRLGLKYSLLTRHTSFIAVREVVRAADGPAAEVSQPLPLPRGVSRLAVGGMAQGSEPGLAIVASVFLLVLAGWGIRRRKGARA